MGAAPSLWQQEYKRQTALNAQLGPLAFSFFSLSAQRDIYFCPTAADLPCILRLFISLVRHQTLPPLLHLFNQPTNTPASKDGSVFIQPRRKHSHWTIFSPQGFVQQLHSRPRRQALQLLLERISSKPQQRVTYQGLSQPWTWFVFSLPSDGIRRNPGQNDRLQPQVRRGREPVDGEVIPFLIQPLGGCLS